MFLLLLVIPKTSLTDLERRKQRERMLYAAWYAKNKCGKPGKNKLGEGMVCGVAYTKNNSDKPGTKKTTRNDVVCC